MDLSSVQLFLLALLVLAPKVTELQGYTIDLDLKRTTRKKTFIGRVD